MREHLREPVAVEFVAIHSGVHERGRVETASEFTRYRGGFEVVDLGMQRRMRRPAGAAAVRRDQQQRRVAIADFEPRLPCDVMRFVCQWRPEAFVALPRAW